MQTHERSKIIMPLNLQERHQTLRIPPGWSAPEFSLGQIVSWKITNPHLKADEAWGQIIGLSWWEDTWLYEILPSPNCPLAVAYPKTWGIGNDVEALRADRLTLIVS
jgi:hypothetical protein